jgi:ribosomal protein S18 acetylase RimI-like enzyme
MPNSASSSICVRPLLVAEAELLARLRLEVAAESEVAMGCSYAEEAARPLTVLANQLGSQPGVTFGAFAGNVLVGTASVLLNERKSSAHKAAVWGVLVAPAYRGRSIGRQLVQACIRFAASNGVCRINLVVYAASEVAVGLYQSVGFAVYGRESQALCIDGAYYDALLMSYSTVGHNPSNERTGAGKLAPDA